MKLTYLGTAAAEGLPAVWCNCPSCAAARRLGGKDIRTRSQVLINDDLLLDFPMDTYMHALRFGLDLSAVRNVLITHAHMDHCYPQELLLHGSPYAHNMTSPVVSVYGDDSVLETVRTHNKAEQRPEIAASVRLCPIKPYDVVETDGYRVLALPANHTKGEDCLVYVVERDGKSAFLFNDSGVLDGKVYDRMAESGVRLDLISFDCTYGLTRHGPGRHMGVPDTLDELEKMRRRGLVHAGTKCILTHFSHNGNLTHAELEEKTASCGMIPAYDGFTVEL